MAAISTHMPKLKAIAPAEASRQTGEMVLVFLFCLSNAFGRLYNHFGFCLCVCPSTDRLSNDYVRNSLPIFTKFCMPLRNVVFRRLLFVGKTGSRLPILEMCKIRFW